MKFSSFAPICGSAFVLFVAGCVPASPSARVPVKPLPPLRAATVPPPAPSSTPVRSAPSARLTPAAPVRSDFTAAGELEQGGWVRGQVPSGTVSARLGDEPVRFDATGHFFAGLDRDAPESETLVAKLQNGRTITRALAIAPRQWRIERVNVPMHKGGPSEAFMKIRRPELAAINAARAMRSNADGWAQKFIWPVKGRISGLFGSQRIYQGVPGAYHSGIDIATGESGTPYVAPADGVVVLASQKPFSLEGNLLIIDHGMGLNSAFLHSSRIVVHQWEHVKQGQLLGYIGATGRATGPHLHWSLKWEDSRLDPLLFTGPMP